MLLQSNRHPSVQAHFGFDPDEKGLLANVDEVISHHCQRKVPASWGISSNLRSHLRIKHPVKYAEHNDHNAGGETLVSNMQ